MDDLDAGVLLVVEAARKRVAEHQDVHALPFEIPLVVQKEFLFPARGTRGQLLLLDLLPALPLTALPLALALPLRGLLRLILPGLLRLILPLSLNLGKDDGDRGQCSRDEEETRADVHADDPYLAEGTATGFEVTGLTGFRLTDNISVHGPISSGKCGFCYL